MYRRVASAGVALTICAALLPLPSVASLISEAAQGQSEERRGRARPGKPEGTLPNLDEIRNESQIEREAPPPIPSIMPSKRNSGKPWDGRRVGDPPQDQTRRAHARTRRTPPPLYDNQFVQNFFTLALMRDPSANETTHWYDQLRVAYAQGQTSLKLAAIELGRTLFESADYAGRNRNAHNYVYDLYKTYLMREPDSGGWTTWENLVTSHGREYVRRGFEESGEFANVIASLGPNGSPTSNAVSLISASVDPRNQPGNGMLTRDATWSLPLLSLPGRAGLDLGLVLSYSSQVWTLSDPYMYFDEDNGFPSPGFRLGFPTVQRKVFDAQTTRNAYLFVTGSGHRVELRQVGTSNIYDATDSSYLRLTENGATLLVHSTDGTKLSFSEINGEYRCVEIKDRNGNYITINYNTLGQIASITDTLERTLTFNYDIYQNLISITQPWGTQTHQWATFGWISHTMHPSFGSLKVVGTADNTVLPLLMQVGLPDGTRYNFEYTNAAQVSVIRRYRADNTQPFYTVYQYESTTTDCPRLSQTRVAAENWTSLNGVPGEVTTYFGVDPDGACRLTVPDGTVYKEYYGTGWQKGLTILSEVWSSGVKQKWTTTAWTQDNTSASYEVNPRVTETNVYDASGNRRRTTIDYGQNPQYVQYGLPYAVREYAADAVTVMRETFTDYNLSQAYLDRRIIGLVSAIHQTNVSSWQRKITFSYDDPVRLEALPAAAKQHDTAYNTSFTARGNMTAVSRWDVTDIGNAATALTSYTNYFTTGTLKSTTDALGHKSSITYDDSFSDTLNRNTFAYPTKFKDADGFSSSVQYNFHFGGKTQTQGPQGAIQTITYDSIGRLERTTIENNGAYTRYVYGPNFVQSFSTVNNVADEAYTIQVFDGVGRVIASAANHPGSTGGYSAQMTIYNLMGRAIKISNPAEVTGAWFPAGDDAAGWLYTEQTYDWKGRPLVTINQDGTTKTAEYAGCGCAGGQVVTLTDEGTVVNGVTKKRQQRIYTDVLNRMWKTEILNWDGIGPNGTTPNNTVYSTTVTTFNARDQVTAITEYAGAQGSGTFQTTIITYDGYGRMRTKHVPEQSAGLVTTYDYNSDDTIQKITDARGASRTFSYNSRHLITSIVHAVPQGSGIPVPAQVTFSYDAAGNRLSMVDGFGRLDYTYNQLSRLNDETRTFTVPANGIAYGQPAFNNTFKLAYQYNLAGQLTSMTDSSLTTTNYHGSTVSYTYDSTGHLHDVNGSGFANIAQYASGFQYRAWGAPKSFTYSNGLSFERQYDMRLRISQYSIGNRSPNQQNGYAAATVMKSDFNYYADNRIQYSHDNVNTKFDTAYTYDGAGHLVMGYSGSEAYDFFHGTNSGTPTGAYRQTYSHDAWNNLVGRTGNYWGYSDSYSASYNTQNRNASWSYDVDGNVTSDNLRYYTIDGAGQVVDQGDYNDGQMRQIFDADGERLGSYQGWWSGPSFYSTRVRYYLHSSVLDATVSEILPDGLEYLGYVYANGEVIAEQKPGGYAPVEWVHQNPITGSYQITDQYQWSQPQANFDPAGVDVGYSAPQPSGSVMIDGDEKGFLAISNAFASTHQCYFNGLETNCSLVLGMLRSGAGDIAPFQQAKSVIYHGQRTLAIWHSYQDGYYGYVPVTARYIGNGELAYAGKDLPRGYYRTHPRVADTDLSRLNNTGDSESDLARSDFFGLQNPQEPISDNPTVIDNSGSANQSCSIKVSFSGSYDGLPNGSSVANSSAGPLYGIGFSVSVSGLSGNVAIRSTERDPKPRGSWLIEQWVSDFNFKNGEIVRQDTTARMDKLGEAVPRPKRDGNTVSWWDHPGTLATGVQGYFTKRNFYIKAYNGERYCDLAFHLTFRVFRGQITDPGWGQGMYR